MGNYVSALDFASEGIANPPYTTLNDRIELAESYIEEMTGHWFYPRQMTLRLDGTGTNSIHMPSPIISIDAITIWDYQVDVTDLVIYNRHLEGMLNPDDRYNPRLMFQRDPSSRQGPAVWSKGRQSIRVTGKFGFTSYDPLNVEGKTPPGIKRLAKILVVALIKTLDKSITGGGGGPSSSASIGPVVEYRTKEQTIKYANIAKAVQSGSLTGNEEADALIDRYSRPFDLR